MNSRIFRLYFVALPLLLIIGCKKTHESVPEKVQSVPEEIIATAGRISDNDSIINLLKNEYGLVELSSEQVGELQFPTFGDYDSASEYISELDRELELRIPEEPLPIPCDGAGTYTTSLAGSGGLFSVFNLIFTTNGTGLTGATIYATGMPLFWTWNQLGAVFNGNSGCVYGTITYGVQIGNVTLGVIQKYKFTLSFDPNLCSMTFTQGKGQCIN